MDASKLRRGELVAAASGAALFLVMFLPWFSITVADIVDLGPAAATRAADLLQAADPNWQSVEAVGFSAWQVLSVMDLFFLLTALVAVALGVVTAMSETVSVPVALGTATAALGAISTLLVLIRILVPPVPFGTSLWIFIGLLAAAGVAAGGWMSMQDESAPGPRRREPAGDGFDEF